MRKRNRKEASMATTNEFTFKAEGLTFSQACELEKLTLALSSLDGNMDDVVIVFGPAEDKEDGDEGD